MIARLREFIEFHTLLRKGETVAVGYSGGADSTCLLHLLMSAGYKPVAAHLHHGQRREADDEQKRCEAFAREIGVSFVTDRSNVPRLAKERGLGIEEAGREARYDFFKKVSERLDGAKVATAHTLDDHVETILLNIARGSGLAGLSGIPVKRKGIIRPLLWARRAQTRNYCEENGLWFHDDPANEDRRFARVVIRQDVIPALEEVNKQALQNAARLSRIAAEEDALLDRMAISMLANCELRAGSPLEFLARAIEIRLNPEMLRRYPPALLRRGIRLMTAELGNEGDFEQAQQAVEMILSDEKGSVTMEGGEVVVEIGDSLVALRSLRPVRPYKKLLTVPGETISEELGWKITIEETVAEPNRKAGTLKEVIDAESLKGDLFVRPFQPGDRMRPLGLESEKKLQDLTTNAKIGAAVRARLPLLCDGTGPIWAPGVCMAERVAVRPDTKRRLAIQFGAVRTD